MNRRNFLKLAATSSAAIGIPSIVKAETLGLNGKISPSNKITIGVLGSGGQGTGIMRNALGNGTARVIAACDVDRAHRDNAKRLVDSHYKDANACATYLDYQELLARKDIDAVLIGTPDHWHALMTVAAARAGKHIYCEKPASTSIAEGRAMVDAVERAGIVFQIGSMQRSFREFQHALGLVRGGYLGKITRVMVHLPAGGGSTHNTPKPGPDFDYDRWIGPARMVPFDPRRCHWSWRWSYNFAGGQLSDWIGHHYDCAAYAMGVTGMQPIAVDNVTAVMRDDNPLFDTASDYTFNAHYANGVKIEVSSKGGYGVHIEGEDGWVSVDRGRIDFSSPALRNVVVSTRFLELARGAGSHMDNFIECARTGATPRAPVGEAHNVAAVAHLANACIRSGVKGLRWNPGTETLAAPSGAEAYLTRTYRGPYVFPA